MVDSPAATEIPADEASRLLAFLVEMSPDLRGAAIIGAAGETLAATDSAERWAEDVGALLEVADRAGDEPVEQIHIATEQGEVFALRNAGLAAVAVTDRFALASVLFFDLRSILRELAASADAEAA